MWGQNDLGERGLVSNMNQAIEVDYNLQIINCESSSTGSDVISRGRGPPELVNFRSGPCSEVADTTCLDASFRVASYGASYGACYGVCYGDEARVLPSVPVWSNLLVWSASGFHF